MLEDIRCALMKRMHEKYDHACGLDDIICPRITKKFEEIRYARKPAVGGKFEVSSGDDGFIVELDNMTCTCKEWQLTGIPCSHACSAIHFMHIDPIYYMNSYYTVERYKQAYQVGLEPLNSRLMWPKVDGEPIKPPPYRKMPRRPKKKRRRGPEEDLKNPSRLSRHGIQMTCKICHQKGYNKKTCSEANNPNFRRPEKLHVKRGRPRKNSNVGEASTSVGTSNRLKRGRPRKNPIVGENSTSVSTSVRPKMGIPVNNQVSEPSSVTINSDAKRVKKRTLAKKKRMASMGSCLLVCEGSGNIYMNSRVGSSRNVIFVSGSEGVTNAMRPGRGGWNGKGMRGGMNGEQGSRVISKDTIVRLKRVMPTRL